METLSSKIKCDVMCKIIMPNSAPPSEHASAPPSELWKINKDIYSRTTYNGLEW